MTDPMIDLSQRVNEYAVTAARTYVGNQLARPPATGRSRDGAATVTVNGLGDITDVRMRADGVAPEVAARLASAVKAAWTEAARLLAEAEAAENPLARQPGLAEFVEEQLDERYGPPSREQQAEAEPPRRSRVVDDDADFSEHGIMS